MHIVLQRESNYRNSDMYIFLVLLVYLFDVGELNLHCKMNSQPEFMFPGWLISFTQPGLCCHTISQLVLVIEVVQCPSLPFFPLQDYMISWEIVWQRCGGSSLHIFNMCIASCLFSLLVTENFAWAELYGVGNKAL